jgi:undecaprenyl-diphosphatase
MWSAWQAWDVAVLKWVQGFASPGWDAVLSAVANPVAMIPLGVVLAVWVTRGLTPWRAGYLVALAAVMIFVSETLVVAPLANRVGRPRPYQSVVDCRRVQWSGGHQQVTRTTAKQIRTTGSSFPSAHMMSNVALALAVSRVARRRVVTLALAGWCLVLAVARVYMGAHFPSDMLGSALLALAWGLPLCAAIDWAVRRFLPARAANLLDEPPPAF